MIGTDVKEEWYVDLKTAVKQIKKGQAQPFYVLYGSEKYRMDEFVQFMLEQLVPEDNRELAITKMDTSEMPVELVVEEAETPPFLVERKVILVKDQSIFGTGKDGKMEHRTDRLLQYMAEPMDTTIIIFMVQGEKLDERKKTSKAAKSVDAVLAFNPFSAEELVQWVIKQAEQRQCIIEEQAVDVLIRSAGTKLQALSSEMEKLCLYVGQSQQIDVHAVESLVPKNTEQNVFQLVEDIIGKRTDRALSTLHELLKQKEEPIKIVALIVRQLRIMLQVKELTGQSFSQQQAASQLGLHPYAVKMAAEQARSHPASALAAWLTEAAELDYEMKSGRVEKTLGLELFIMRLSSGVPRHKLH